VSVLSLWLLSSNRTRAARFGGTSTTASPAATSCCASKAPVPVAPSNRPQPRGELTRPAQQPLTLPTISGQTQHRLDPLIAVEYRGGVGTAVRVDPDHEHDYLLVVVVCHGGQT
jgi:hypothetical protein